jgi:hypothetical protein
VSSPTVPATPAGPYSGSPSGLEPALAAQPRLSRFDRSVVWLLAVYGAVALVALALVPARFLPAEDAVILFEYSRNLAQHGVIAFTAGGPPVEGATDFGWMVLIAGAMRCGIPPFWFCAAANVLALLALGWVLLRIAGLRSTALRLLAVAGSAALFRQIFAAASGFSVLPDALMMATLTWLVLERRATLAALAGLAYCLLRPDGVVFTVPLLIWLLLSPGATEADASAGRETKAGSGAGLGVATAQKASTTRSAALVSILLGFVLPGIAYFLWRWHYFGQLLPLPFLVKADFHRTLGFLILGSARASLVPLLATLLLISPVLLLRRRSNLPLLVSLIAIPTLFFWMMRLDQNVGARFFYYLPTAAAIVIAANWNRLQPRFVLRMALATWVVLLAGPLLRELVTFRSMQFENVRQIATELHADPIHGTILASEAGFIPYFSGWPTVDPWGLNTPEFAHRFFAPDDVERLHPDLIVMHPDMPESCLPQAGWGNGYADRSWPHMTRNIVLGADDAHYELWLLSYGSPFYRHRKHWGAGQGDRECWFVRRGTTVYPEIVQTLKSHGGVVPDDAKALEAEHLHSAN